MGTCVVRIVSRQQRGIFASVVCIEAQNASYGLAECTSEQELRELLVRSLPPSSVEAIVAVLPTCATLELSVEREEAEAMELLTPALKLRRERDFCVN